MATANRSRRHFLRSSAVASLAGLGAGPARPRLRAVGRWFLDERDRVVLLRGVNLAGNSKVPPFRPISHPSDLDPLPLLGFNVVRLIWIWEAFEPSPGRYDRAYLDHMRTVAAECWARGLYVIVDNHQDGYSRNLSRGCGDGFPLWSVGPCARTAPLDNGPDRRQWAVNMITDPGMHASFSAFYADAQGVRSRYLEMWRTVARAFADQPGVIGYDLLNEPWGDERREISPLYEDAAAAIRAEDPSAILFVEGHIATNTGLQTRLPRPGFANFAYAPHYYKLETIVTRGWHGGSVTTAAAFRHMTAKAAQWGVPLFLGEFGAPAGADRIGAFIDSIYDRLDASLTSAAQWCHTPMWDPVLKDGWNGEDFSIATPADGRLRPNFLPRPHPVAVAGTPIRFRFVAGDGSGRGHFGEFSWDHAPERGETEIFVPRCRFPEAWTTAIDAPQAAWSYDEARQRIVVACPARRILTLRIRS